MTNPYVQPILHIREPGDDEGTIVDLPDGDDSVVSTSIEKNPAGLDPDEGRHAFWDEALGLLIVM
jgi:hypothetical protein